MELEKLDNLNLGKSMLYLHRKKFLQARQGRMLENNINGIWYE
jgi:beta-N-acetylglucosaminidase